MRDSGKGVLPVRDQLRLGWRVFRWVFWKEGVAIWANAAFLIVWAAASMAVIAQAWLALLAAVVLTCVIAWTGTKDRS